MASGLGIENKRVVNNFVPEIAAEIHGRAQVDLASAKHTAQVGLDVGKSEEANAFLGPELDEDVDIAPFREPVSEYGAEQRQPADAMVPAKVRNVALWDFDLRQGHTSPIMAQGRGIYSDPPVISFSFAKKAFF